MKETDSELGVFITPHIFRDEAPSDTDLATVEAEDDLAALWNKSVIKDRDRMSQPSQTAP